VISRPPTRMIEVGRRSSSRRTAPTRSRGGSIRELPRQQEGRDSPTFDGLKDDADAVADHVLREQRARPRRARTRTSPLQLQWSFALHCRSAAGSAPTPLPVRIALAGQTARPGLVQLSSPTSMTGAHEDRRQDLRDRRPEPEGDLAQEVDRDDHRGEVEPWGRGCSAPRTGRCVRRSAPLRPAGFAGGSGAAGPGVTSGAAGSSVTDRTDVCVVDGCGSFRTSSQHGFDGKGYRTRSPISVPTHEQGAQMIPTEPIGSIPRPKTLIDGMAAFAEGTISPESSAGCRTTRSRTRSSASKRRARPLSPTASRPSRAS
jgi:hypothetical protein